MQPNITEREAQPYARIRHALEREKLSDFVPGSLNKAFGFLQKHRLNTPGAGISPCCLLFAAAFSHAIPLPTKTSCWQMHPMFIKIYRAFVSFRVEYAA